MVSGILDDEAAAISIALEGILYGEYHCEMGSSDIQMFTCCIFRLFTHVYWYYLGIDEQTKFT